MHYKLKAVINDVEIFDDASLNSTESSIAHAELKNSTSLSCMGIGASASDALYLSILNPYKPSFDGDRVDFYISALDDDSDELGALAEEVGTSTDGSALDSDDAVYMEEAEEAGEDMTQEEIAEAEALSDEYTENVFRFFDGEPMDESEAGTEVLVDDEWIHMGTFYVYEQQYVDDTVMLTCLDGFSRMSLPFVPTEKAAFLSTLYADFRTQLFRDTGILADDMTFPHDRAVMFDMDVTYRDAMGYFAGAVGGYATFDGDATVGISYYSDAGIILLDSNIIYYVETSAGETTIEGMSCNRDISPYRDDIIEVGTGQSISFVNPFITEDGLQEIFDQYKGLRFSGAKVQARWRSQMQAGSFLRIMSADEYRQFVAIGNAIMESPDSVALKAQSNEIGKVILISNQTINFSGDAQTIIDSICDPESQKQVNVSPFDAKFKSLYAEMIKADYIDAKKVVTEALQAMDAVIQNLISENIKTLLLEAVGSNSRTYLNNSMLAIGEDPTIEEDASVFVKSIGVNRGYIEVRGSKDAQGMGDLATMIYGDSIYTDGSIHAGVFYDDEYSSKAQSKNDGTLISAKWARSLFAVEEKSLDNVSVAASTSVDSTVTITKSGYTPIGVVGTLVRNASSSGAQWGNVSVVQAQVNNSTQCGVRLFNKGTAAAKVKVTVTILYKAN